MQYILFLVSIIALVIYFYTNINSNMKYLNIDKNVIEFCTNNKINNEKQFQIIDLVVQGHNIKTISEIVGISESGVKYHLALIYKRIGIKNRGEFKTIYNLFFVNNLAKIV